jgi:deoxyhypusine synthase
MTDDHSRELHDGREDGLTPLEALDVRHIGSFAEMLRAMSKTAFGGRNLGEAFDVLRAMTDDPDCTVVVTVAGAMTIAKQGRLLCEMIDRGMADIVISTGALMAHGLSEAIGGVHYRHDPGIPDRELYLRGYNRVYDTLEMEANLSHTEDLVSEVLGQLDFAEPISSSQLNREIGRRLVERGQMPSILGCAFQRDVPVYVPALTDSELGLGVAVHFIAQNDPESTADDAEGFFSRVPPFNPFLDLLDYTRRVLRAKRLGVFTIGGGVPRNWAQQVGPFIDITNARLGTAWPAPKFHYGVRICPEPVHWGGLSGCTYAEGVSWGKFVSPEDGGRFAEVYCDATIAWPLLVRAMVEEKEG